MRQTGWRLALKRALDVTIAGAALLATAPVLITCAVAIRATMGSPVLFKQARPGKGGRIFTLYKLRTMSNDGDRDIAKDAMRITPLGNTLRRLSMDELPQLWNVIRGDMSLVGPRPLLVQYLDRYSREQMRRHDVLPGITGWAQIRGRNAIAWEDKFALDVWYVDHWNLTLDLRILLGTFTSVLKREGIASEGHATMPEFMGTHTPS